MTRLLLRPALAAFAAACVAASPAAATTTGHAWAWGNNADGELGNGTITRYGGIATPVQVSKLTAVRAVAGGSDFSLALKSDGTVWAWGNGGWGQLGQGVYGSSTAPLQIPALSGVSAIAAGDLHALALKADGTVWGWGFNYYGQVGNGTSGPNVLSPARVSSLNGVIAIAAGSGGHTSYALKSDGTVWAWGYDGLGQLGNGTSDERAHPRPVRVLGLSGVAALAAGSSHGLAVLADGTVRAWGSDQSDQLGAPTAATCGAYADPCSTTPIRVPNLSGVTSVAGGGGFSLARSGGTVWGWGDNGHGQLATGTTTITGWVARATKTKLQSTTAIAAGGAHTLALRSDGTVWAAGDDHGGQLGTGAFADSANPVRVLNVSGAASVAAGLDHSLAVGP